MKEKTRVEDTKRSGPAALSVHLHMQVGACIMDKFKIFDRFQTKCLYLA
jgi:hypothetical protein